MRERASDINEVCSFSKAFANHSISKALATFILNELWSFECSIFSWFNYHVGFEGSKTSVFDSERVCCFRKARKNWIFMKQLVFSPNNSTRHPALQLTQQWFLSFRRNPARKSFQIWITFQKRVTNVGALDLFPPSSHWRHAWCACYSSKLTASISVA